MRLVLLMGAAAALATVAHLGTAASHAAPDPGIAPRSGIPKGAWVGTSTNMTGDFSYGRVSFTVGRGVIRDFTIEGVAVSGCGGYKSIVVPRLTISGRTMSGRYVPVPGVDDVITVTARFAGGAIKGTFSEGPLCSGAGRFTARPR